MKHYKKGRDKTMKKDPQELIVMAAMIGIILCIVAMVVVK